jgi:hypothetical protein
MVVEIDSLPRGSLHWSKARIIMMILREMVVDIDSLSVILLGHDSDRVYAVRSRACVASAMDFTVIR